MGGHVTPTFGHGSGGGGVYPPNLGGPPLSPNRGMSSMTAGNPNLNRGPFGLRHHDRRSIISGIG